MIGGRTARAETPISVALNLAASCADSRTRSRGVPSASTYTMIVAYDIELSAHWRHGLRLRIQAAISPLD